MSPGFDWGRSSAPRGGLGVAPLVVGDNETYIHIATAMWMCHAVGIRVVGTGETGMNVKMREQAEAKVQALAAKLTDEALCLAWMATEGKPATQELALVRGWIMDELNERLGDDLFDEWLMAVDENGNGVSPFAYLVA